jgi:hypothetical protein
MIKKFLFCGILKSIQIKINVINNVNKQKDISGQFFIFLEILM